MVFHNSDICFLPLISQISTDSIVAEKKILLIFLNCGKIKRMVFHNSDICFLPLISQISTDSIVDEKKILLIFLNCVKIKGMLFHNSDICFSVNPVNLMMSSIGIPSFKAVLATSIFPSILPSILPSVKDSSLA